MKKTAVAAMMMAVLSGSAYAESAQFMPNFSADSISVATSIGMLGGKSKELVYDASNARKVSQLDWKTLRS
jgi:plasminogen activator